MTPPPTFVLIPPRRRRKRREAEPAAPGAPLELVAGVFTPGPVLYLTFDRAVDVSSLVAAAIVVDDGDSQVRYDAGGAVTLDAPETVRIELANIGAAPAAPQVSLTAAAGNGIVAADDGGAWAGVTDFVLQVP